MFSNLTKNVLKNFKMKKRFEIIFFCWPKYGFWTKDNYISVVAALFCMKLFSKEI